MEFSVSQVAVTAAPERGRHYGPGMQAGYQFTAKGGFTLLLSAGVGIWRRENQGATTTEFTEIGNIAIGYTWPHR